MNEENQQPNKTNTNKQTPDDSSRSADSPGVVDRGLSSSENTSKNNTEESSKDSEMK